MAFRADVSIDYNPSPRVAQIAAPSAEIIVQDAVDTLRDNEATFQAMTHPKLLNASGKDDLGGGVLVGLTASYQDLLWSPEARTDPAETGTVTTGSSAPTGTPPFIDFIDSAADFTAAAVARGSLVINFSDFSVADVTEVVSSTRLRTRVLKNGTTNTFQIGDIYHVFNIEQIRFTGGNWVSVDSDGLPLPSPILPSAFTQVVVTSSSSATLQELTEIRFSTYMGAVWYQTGSGNSGTAYDNGTPLAPVDNFQDAKTIADALGFTKIRVVGDATLDTGDDLDGFILEGDDPQLSTITVNPGASVLATQFRQCTLTGTLDGNSVVKNSVIQPPLNFVEGTVRECVIEAGTITLGGSSDANFIDCKSGVAGQATPIIDYGGSGRDLIVRDWTGGLELRNKTGADAASLDVNGQVIVAASCTVGPIVIRGSAKVTDLAPDGVVIDETLFTMLIELWKDHGLDPSSPKTITEVTPQTEFDESAGGITKEVRNPTSTTTTITRT